MNKFDEIDALEDSSYWAGIEDVEDYFKDLLSIIFYIEESSNIKQTPYLCSSNKLTIGIGCNLEANTDIFRDIVRDRMGIEVDNDTEFNDTFDEIIEELKGEDGELTQAIEDGIEDVWEYSTYDDLDSFMHDNFVRILTEYCSDITSEDVDYNNIYIYDDPEDGEEDEEGKDYAKEIFVEQVKARLDRVGPEYLYDSNYAGLSDPHDKLIIEKEDGEYLNLASIAFNAGMGELKSWNATTEAFQKYFENMQKLSETDNFAKKKEYIEKAARHRTRAWFELRYTMNGDNENGIAKRRYLETDMFGLYSDKYEDYLSDYKVNIA